MNLYGISYRNRYFQTWAFTSKVTRWRFVGAWLGAAIRWGCGKVTGHTPSKTEWGYGGGDNADVWCRWCNQLGSMPVSKALDRFENMRSTVWGMTGCDLKHDRFAATRDGTEAK